MQKHNANTLNEAELTAQLHDFAASISPDGPFATQLKQQLLKSWENSQVQSVSPAYSPKIKYRRTTMLKKLVATTMLLVTTAVLLFTAKPDSKQPVIPLVSGLAPVSVLAQTLSNQGINIDEAAFIWATDVPANPITMTVYQATSLIPSFDEAYALNWAYKLGLQNPQIYTDSRRPDYLLVQGDNQQKIEIEFDSGILYYTHEAIALETQPLPYEQAVDVAVTFLTEHGLLPEAYRVVREPHLSRWGESGSASATDQFINIVRVVDEYPLVGQWSDIGVYVGPDGQVRFADLRLLDYEPVADYSIRSIEDAYSAMFNSATDCFQLSGYNPSLTREESEPVITHTPGEEIVVIGWVNTWVSTADNTPLLKLLDQNTPNAYELQDVPHQSELMVTNGRVRITGTVERQLGTKTWELSVTDWESVEQDDVSGASYEKICLTGTLLRGDGGDEILTDAGERYKIKNPPLNMADGISISLCTYNFPKQAEEEIDWHSIETQEATPRPNSMLYMDENIATSSSEFQIEQAELAYSYQKSPTSDAVLLQPTWIFRGCNTNNTYCFTAYIRATI